MSYEIETVEFYARQGVDFVRRFKVYDDNDLPVDMANVTLVSQLRKSLSQDSELIIDFVTEGLLKVDPYDTTYILMEIPATYFDNSDISYGIGDLRIMTDEMTLTPFQFTFKVSNGVSV